MINNQDDEIDVDEIYAYIYDIEDDLKLYEQSYFHPNSINMHTGGEGIAAISAVLLCVALYAGGWIVGQPLGIIAVLVVSIAVKILQIRIKDLWDKIGLEAIGGYERYKSRGGDKAVSTKDAYLKTVVIARVERALLNRSVTFTYLFSALYALISLVAPLTQDLASKGLWEINIFVCSTVGLLGALYYTTKVYFIHRNASLFDVSKV